MRVCLKFLGCKVNQAEVLQMESALKAHGHEIVSEDEQPDYSIINTCTVTAKSDYQSRQLIRRASKVRSKVIVTGCYAQMNQEALSSQEITFVSNADKDRIINMIDSHIESNSISYSSHRSRAFIKVQDGCDNGCTYCIVWKARGLPRSVPSHQVIEAINRAHDDGYNEVILTGVHLGLYGKDSGENLANLLNETLTSTSIPRIRLSSLEVSELNIELISAIDNPRICKHLHVPLQGGHDGVLRDMKRRYTVSEYAEKLIELRERFPGCALGADVIAGFPSEGIDAFEQTVELLTNLPLTYMHVFPYSKRPGTEAALLKDLVGDTERKRRASRLRDISAMKKQAFLRSLAGQTLEVLVERPISKEHWEGLSHNYARFRFISKGIRQGSLQAIAFERTDGTVIYGKTLGIDQTP